MSLCVSDYVYVCYSIIPIGAAEGIGIKFGTGTDYGLDLQIGLFLFP